MRFSIMVDLISQVILIRKVPELDTFTMIKSMNIGIVIAFYIIMVVILYIEIIIV